MNAGAALLARPMPVMDSGLVWPLASWAGDIAADLTWLRGVLAGPLGEQTGWAGSAELACAEAMATHSAQLVRVVARFEGYAATLAGYARALERLGPRLTGARRRLEAHPDDASAAAELDRWWREWEAARDRCVTGLRAAGTGEGTRHWWSGWAGRVSPPAWHGMSLTGLSHALAELGQGLVVAGLVCALVCPPAAGAIWAAVAVVAVCQLAVDATRRARGEPVGWAGLGWDVAAALPAGRGLGGFRALSAEMREWHSAAEASAAIERLPVSLRSSPLVPGGLKAHEGSATYRGHTILKHLDKTPGDLVRRFKDEPHLKWSSSFTDRQTAEAAIAQALDENRAAISEWLAQPWPTYRLVNDVGTQVGLSVAKDGTIVSSSKVHVTLRKENTVLGYYIKTAYPAP